jgi:hypothetical protein
VFFLPLWVFIDNVLRGPQPFGIWSAVAGWTVAALTSARRRCTRPTPTVSPGTGSRIE